jgi:hypothetical protein
MAKIYTSRFAEVPGIAEVGIDLANANDSRIRRVLENEGIKYSLTSEGAIVGIDDKEAKTVLSRLNGRLLTSDEYLALYDFAKQRLEDPQFRALYESMNATKEGVLWEMVDSGEEGVIAASEGELYKDVICDKSCRHGHGQINFLSSIGLREARQLTTKLT